MAKTTTLRRWYFLSLVLGFAVVVLVRLFVLPEPTGESDRWVQVTSNVADNLIATILVAIAVGALVPFLFPSNDSSESIELLDTKAIEDAIEEATKDAREWNVRARTANYFSRHTLPWLTKAALKGRRPVNIKMQLLDPENEDLLRAYARMRSNPAKQWTVDRVRLEIYASILEAAICKQEAPRINITVGLSSMNWVMSLDLSDEMALVTGQNKGEPGLLFSKASEFFTGWCDDFESAFAGCRHLIPEHPGITRSGMRQPTDADIVGVRKFFSSLGLNTCASDDELRKVIAQRGAPDNYA
ncbi:hypothetical protein [Modestobacter sp. I12A-02662]|uniref:hypothetical protein n=1 Tax=Modestobacter sp. I12A-02662 TaxID=1730496 RepID=UPI0034DF1678